MPTDPLAPDAVAQAMTERRDEWLDVVSTLVNIPSENPPGDTTAIADWYTDFLDSRGIPYEVIAPKESMPNVVAQFDGEARPAGDDGDDDERSWPHLAFNGHLDTFPRRDEERWECDPFSGAVVDGKIHGRGVSDMHAGFTASLAAFCYLFEHREHVAGRVTIAAVSDEETGGTWGTEYLVENYPEYRGNVVVSGEPSSNGIVRFGERGRAWVELSVRGESAHTCSVPRGVSAIEDLLDLLADVRTLPEDEALSSVPREPRQVILDAREQMDAAYGEGATDRILVPRVNVGTVEGGEKVNLVAEHARAEVDIRLPLGTSTEAALERVRAFADDYDSDVDVTAFSRKEPTYSDHTHPIFGLLRDAAARSGVGPTPAFSCALAGTDCAFYREKGIPCAVYGPSPHNLGSQNEFVLVDDFTQVLEAQAVAAAAYLSANDWDP